MAETVRSHPVAFVTGASSGIGEQVARRLAARGYRTVLVARRLDLLERLALELAAVAPSEAEGLDLSDAAAVEPAMRRLVERHGAPDVVVNNAGYGQYAPFLEHAAEDHRRLMEVNYFAAVSTVRAVLPAMLLRGRGHVINIASMSTKMGPWGHAGYAAAKAALVSLTQTLAAEHADDGVRFSYVNPGIVRTDYFRHPSFAPLELKTRRFAIAAESAADAIVSLLDTPRLELCIPRHYRLLDWLRALHPGLAHDVVRRRSRPEDPKR
jgi:short-subunit dehydrogenase